MALTYIFDIEGVASDLITALLTDLTIYGGSNPARNTLANYLYFYKRDVNLVDSQLTIDNSSPLTVNQYQFSLPTSDGVFVGVIFSFNIWSAGTYAQNACVYYSTNGNYYKANTSTSQTPGGNQWDLITDILGTCTGNTTVQQGQFYAWSSAHAQTGILGDAMADLGQKLRDGKCRNWEDSANVITASAAIDSAFTNFRRTSYTTAQSIMDWINAQTSLTI